MNEESMLRQEELNTESDTEEVVSEEAAEEPSTEEPSTNSKPPFSKQAAAAVFDICETFAWSVFVVILLFTFAFRLCRVDGRSMENSLYNGQNLLVYSMNYTPRQDDIVVFHLTDESVGMTKALVKRVIATEGQTVEINFTTGKILVDGIEYADAHAVLKDKRTDQITGTYSLYADHSYDSKTNTFQATVPEGCLFVMGDNRNNSKDSRDTDISFLDERCVLGKAILRVAPFTLY